MLEIEDSAFEGCSSLTSVVIPNGVKKIEECTFQGCSSLASIGIPNSVTGIGNSAFCGCSSLALINIPNVVTIIGRAAFSECTSLTSVDIPDSVESIGDYAFSFCTNLTSVEIPGNVTSIGKCIFENCTSLIKICVSDVNKCFSAVDGVIYSKDLTEVVCFPPGIKGDYYILDGVIRIGWGAFDGCSSLTSIKIPQSVTSIYRCAFYQCSGLTSIVIPDSVMYIEANAFKFCGRLKNIHFRNEHPENIEISESAFWGKHLCTLYVPADAEEAYRHDERFKDFKEIKTER